jgi:hypothetical protein
MRIATSGISWTRVQTPWRLSAAFKALYVAFTAATALATMLFGVPFIGMTFGVLGMLVWGLLIASYVLSQVSAWKQGSVEVTDTALLVHPSQGTPRRVDRRSIVGALVVERPIGGGLMQTVEVELAAGDRFTIAMSEAHTARELVERLGFGPGGRRIRSRIAMPGRRFLNLPIALAAYVFVTFPLMVLSAILVGGPLTAASGVLMPVALLLVYTLGKRLASAPEVVIGSDGVRVERGYGSRFFPVNDPALWSALRGLGIDDIRVASVLRRAEERANAAAPAEPGAFARGGRSLDDWRRALAAMFEGGYRESPRSADEAARVLSSAASPPEARIGAAMALRVAGETERVRVAAEATADDRVRIALEAVADEESDATIEKALRKMSVR